MMNIFNMVLAFLLAPFFLLNFSVSSATFTQPESVPPKVTSSLACLHIGGTLLGSIPDGQSFEDCLSIFEEQFETGTVSIIKGWDTFCSVTEYYWVDNEYILEYTASDYVGSVCKTHLTSNRYKIGGTVPIKTCPPDEYPNHIYGKDNDEDGQPDTCHLSKLDSCPKGNYAYKVGGECVPVQCEAQGSGGSIWAKGDIYSNNAGTYCDGSCAHTVEGGQNLTGSSGNVAIYGVSTGQSCGQGTDFAMHDGDGEDCTSIDVGTGTNYLSCSNTAETPETEPPLDLQSEEYVLEEMQELIPVEETCSIGDISCEIRNLKETTKTENSEQKQLDVEMHNLAIQSQEKSTQSVLDTLNDNSNQQTQGLEMINNTLKDIKNSGVGGGVGGGSSDGFCDQEGNCSTGVETKTEPSEGLKGFWVSEYEDGLEGIFNDKLAELQSSDFYVFLESFSPTISGGSAPDMNMCFDLGFISFGCQSFSIDPRVYPAIGVFILISAAFLCRFILFGG